jgi:N-methylhydantoinase B
MYDLMFGGYGGRSDKDGAEALAPVMNCRNIPVEVHETHNPVRIHCLELIQDTGGAGKYRGGLGLRKDIELLAEEAIMTGLGDRHDTQPYGIFGGKAGARAETILNPDTHPQTLGSKDVTSLRRGDIVSFRLAGAGGYGPPAERDLKAIRRDIADGYISFNAAARDYGVKN